MKKYDLVVIGSGAGLMVIEAALSEGLNCALVEKAKFGGTCLTKGCIPSKMLVYPADLIREAESAARIGLSFGVPDTDWAKISSRIWKQINYNKEIEKNLSGVTNLDVYKGTAEFTAPYEIKVNSADGKQIGKFRADKTVIAAGARSFVPSIEGLEQTGYITSESFFGEKYPDSLWKKLVIIGGGAIGTEFAHIFSALGTKVTLIQSREHIIPTEEEEISQFVLKNLRNNGVEVITSARTIRAMSGTAGKVIVVENTKTGGTTEIEADEIFISSGIRSNGDTLKLAAAGIETDKRGYIAVNDYLETSLKGVYAIGDINGKYQFRHKANYEATLLSENLFGAGQPQRISYDSVPWAIFTHPQVGHVGMTEREVREKGIEYGIARNYYSSIAGGISMGISSRSDDNGFAKIILGKNMKILGVHIVGPHASMLVQPFVYLMNAGLPCQKHSTATGIMPHDCPNMGTVAPMINSMVIHPSMNELAAWALENVEWVNE